MHHEYRGPGRKSLMDIVLNLNQQVTPFIVQKSPWKMPVQPIPAKVITSSKPGKGPSQPLHIRIEGVKNNHHLNVYAVLTYYLLNCFSKICAKLRQIRGRPKYGIEKFKIFWECSPWLDFLREVSCTLLLLPLYSTAQYSLDVVGYFKVHGGSGGLIAFP
jgi:hypothetical protein